MECYCPYNSNAIEDVKMRTARNRRDGNHHQCDECFRPIRPGEIYYNYDILYDGEWSHYKLHYACHNLARAMHCECLPFGEHVGQARDSFHTLEGDLNWTVISWYDFIIHRIAEENLIRKGKLEKPRWAFWS